MFNFETISEYQLEVTSYCNAACPQCPRNNCGHGINPRMPLRHLDRAVIDRSFSAELCGRLRQIFFCGSYGDPIMHPDLLDILRDFRTKNPHIWLYMHTNGGTRDADYWQELADIMGGRGRVDFGIDGVGDTLSIYRRQVRYDTVIRNAQAFIDAGGNAQWNFIVFEHNQHQIKEAELIANDLGFEKILFRKTGRFFDQASLSKLESWPVRDTQQHTITYLRPTTLKQFQNSSVHNAAEVAQNNQQWHDYFDTTEIRCDAMLGHKVAVNCQGLVLPCNFFNHNLYDARFYDAGVLPGANPLSMPNGKNQVRSFLERYDLSSFDLHKHTLEEIFASPMWSDLVSSWSRGLSDGRLFECAFTCGARFHKVWDQNAI